MFEYEIEIDRPLPEVYRAFKDPDNLPRWLTGLQRTEPISGRPGEVGSKTRQIYLERGRTVELIETITAHEPERRFAGTIEGQGMNGTLEVEFEDKGENTILRMRSDITGCTLLMRLLMPFFKGSIRKRQLGDLQRFGEKLEAGELRT